MFLWTVLGLGFWTNESGYSVPASGGSDRRYVVVDAPGAGTAKKRKCLVVWIEHYLLCLAGIRSDDWHPAVVETNMGNLERRGHSVEQDDLLASVERYASPGSKVSGT